MDLGLENTLFAFAPEEIGAVTAVDHDFRKASFQGDRSAAGRYAAQQRWKNHRKKDDAPKDPRRAALLERVRATRSLVAKAEQELAKYPLNGLPTTNLGWGAVAGFSSDEQVMERLREYDSVKGLGMVLLRVPEQADKAGNLRRKSVYWANDDRLATTLVEIPSPEMMQLEQSINAVGQEVIDYADTVLKESGVTQSKINRQIEEVRQKVVANDDLDQEMRYQFDPYANEDYADRSRLTPEEKAIVETTSKTNEEWLVAERKQKEAKMAGVDATTLKSLTKAANDAFIKYENAKEALGNAIDNNPVIQECQKRGAELAAKRASIKSMTERRYEIINGLLSESRTMGAVEPKFFFPPPDPSGKPTYQEQVTQQVADAVKKHIPSDIVSVVNDKYPNITVLHSINNGYWDRNGKTIATQPNRTYIHLHEYIHAIASASPLAHAMEVAMLVRRTTGKEETVAKGGKFDSSVLAEGRQRVRKTLSYRGGKGKTDHLPDKFVDPYQGRLYEHGSTETLTVAHDLIYTDERTRDVGPKKMPKQGSIADRDSSGTIIGLLFTLGATE